MKRCNSSGSQILVAGTARSGTTWLAKMIDSHPATLYRHEPDYPPLFPSMPVLVHPDQAEAYKVTLQIFARNLPDLNRLRASGTLPVFRKNSEGLINLYGRYIITGAARLAGRRLGNIRVPDVFQPPRKDGLRIVWKSVNSVGRLGMIASALQPIKIVFLLRHPCGVVFSILNGMEQGVKAPAPRGEIEELINCRSNLVKRLLAKMDQHDYLELEAFRWAVLNSNALEELKDRPGCVIVRYEDLYTDPLAAMNHILQSVGLPWDTQVESFIRRSTKANSSRYYGLYRRPESVDLWRRSTPVTTQNRVMEIVRGSLAGDLYIEE